MRMNWKSKIKDIILYRGEDYYLDGKVKDIERDGDVYSAHVEGTETYETSVEVKNGELLFWSCDCPYDRGICKHVAALLFAIENEFEDNKNSSNSQKTLQNKDKSDEKSIKYIETSLNKLSRSNIFNADLSGRLRMLFNDAKSIFSAKSPSFCGSRPWASTQSVISTSFSASRSFAVGAMALGRTSSSNGSSNISSSSLGHSISILSFSLLAFKLLFRIDV